MLRVAIGFGVLVMIAAGVLLGWHGVREYTLAAGTASTPQRIRCEDLAANGPGNNAYVTITGVTAAPTFVSANSADGRFNRVWVPAVPAGAAGALSSDGASELHFNVVITSAAYADREKVTAGLLERHEISGIVVNRIDSLGAVPTTLLREHYANFDPATVWLVEEDRKPPSSGLALAMMAGAAALIMLAMVWLIRSTSNVS